MAGKMTKRLPPNAASPSQEANNRLPDAQRTARNRAMPASPDGAGELEEVENMLQTAIQAISPDPDEISERLARAKNADATEANRQIRFGLILTVVALVFLILAFDLLLAGV